MNRRSFLSVSPLILVPEPRRVYSFVGGWRDPVAIEYERVMSEACDLIRQRLAGPLGADVQVERGRIEQAIREALESSLPIPTVTVECLTSRSELLHDRRLSLRVTVTRPLYSPQFGWM